MSSPNLHNSNTVLKELNFNYPNLGSKNPEIDGKIKRIISDATWKCQVRKILSEKPTVFGACCGSTPEHIRIIKEIIQARSVE